MLFMSKSSFVETTGKLESVESETIYKIEFSIYLFFVLTYSIIASLRFAVSLTVIPDSDIICVAPLASIDLSFET